MLELAFAESRRVVILTMRYPMEFALGVVLMGALFYGIVLGTRVLGAEATPQAMTSLAMGYAVWILAAGPVVGIASDVQSEAAGGTLENLFMSRFSLLQVLVARAVVSFVHSLAFVAVLVLLILAVERIEVHMPPAVLAYLAVLLLGAMGIGLVLAGAALLLKRVHFLLVAVYALLFPLAFASPPGGTHAGRGMAEALLPLVQVAGGLKAALATGASMPVTTLAGAAAGSLAWLAIGVLAFVALLRRAERLGTISER